MRKVKEMDELLRTTIAGALLLFAAALAGLFIQFSRLTTLMDVFIERMSIIESKIESHAKDHVDDRDIRDIKQQLSDCRVFFSQIHGDEKKRNG